MKKYLIISFVILSLSLTLLAYFCLDDNNLIPQGNEVVQKIESFKLEHKRLPTGLSELGIEDWCWGIYELLFRYKRMDFSTERNGGALDSLLKRKK